MKHYCTYFDAKYLDRGLAFHESMQEHCQPYRLYVMALCDATVETLIRLGLPNVEVVPWMDILTDELEKAGEDRSRHEWIWTLTPFWMLWLFKDREMRHLSYLDADCYFYGSPDALFGGELFDVDVAITPHRYSPDRRWMEAGSGKYNVGWVFVRRNWAGLTCVENWAARCLERCAQSEGADQKYWDDLLPEYQGHAIRHKGVDLAPWNQAGQYRYSLCDGQVYVDDDPLVMYHFHKRLEPGFELDPFVAEHVYPPYGEALERARERAK
jgi:hypothetical protein